MVANTGMHEVGLIQRLTEQKRRFMKPLRYDARSTAPFSNALLLDTGEVPTPLHVLSEFMDPKERAAKEKMIKANGGGRWVWYTDSAMPALHKGFRGALLHACVTVLPCNAILLCHACEKMFACKPVLLGRRIACDRSQADNMLSETSAHPLLRPVALSPNW